MSYLKVDGLLIYFLGGQRTFTDLYLSVDRFGALGVEGRGTLFCV